MSVEGAESMELGARLPSFQVAQTALAEVRQGYNLYYLPL